MDSVKIKGENVENLQRYKYFVPIIDHQLSNVAKMSISITPINSVYDYACIQSNQPTC